ncbi:hypothetical protein HOH87_02960 [bacterium]|jgi:multicomponent Na+:H+ antiporter subunit C|nr:hypothetical protein [bacterium]
MTTITILIVGVLFSTSVYLILQRNIIPILFGFSLLNHAANIFLLAVSGDPTGKKAPIVTLLGESYVDPLPQALLLTAIVIGFGVTAYLIVLLYRIYLSHSSTNIEDIYND